MSSLIGKDLTNQYEIYGPQNGKKKNGQRQLKKKKYLHIKRENNSILLILNYKLNKYELPFLIYD